MANTTLQLKRSGTTTSTPSALEYGELAINYADGILFYKNVNDVIVEYTPSLGYFGTVNVDGSLVVASINDSVLRVLPGNNVILSANTSNDSFSVAADLSSAWSWADYALSTASAAYATANAAGGGITAVVEDTTPDLGGNLDAYQYNISNVGTLTATTKSFDITHPDDPSKRLIYGSLEGPEHGVYARGKNYMSEKIELPQHWKNLIDWDTITVQLTPRGRHQQLYVTRIDSGNCNVYVGDTNEYPMVEYYYLVQAERKDVPKLRVEI